MLCHQSIARTLRFVAQYLFMKVKVENVKEAQIKQQMGM
jgi:hypothetical protein